MSTLLKNEHTGDRLVSKPANDKFRQEWERIFGNTNKAKENNSATDSLPIFLKDQAC